MKGETAEGTRQVPVVYTGIAENICRTVIFPIERWRAITPGIRSFVCGRSDGMTHPCVFSFEGTYFDHIRMEGINMRTTMRNTLSVLLALLLTLGTLLSFASCGEKIDATQDLDNVKAAGKIVVGMECAYAPYNWAQAQSSEYATVKLANGTYADGYDVQIAKKIAEALGVELEIKSMDFSALTSSCTSGEIDLIIAGMSPTEERKETIDFTDTYYDSELVVVVRKGGNYTSATKIADFKGAKLTGQINTFHYQVIDQIEGVNKLPEMDDFAALIQSLASGTIDGYVCEKPGAISAVASNPEFTYIEFAEGNGFTCDPAESSIAIGLRKNSSLTAELNSILGTISKADREQMMNDAIERQPAGEE